MPKGKLVMTVLGGGSFFTPSFVGTMVQKPEIWTDVEVRLQDPNSERVQMVKQFCEKYVVRKKVPMTFMPQPDLDKSLEGADFVITTFRVGGVPALALDESIPPRFGYMGDETAGPGGMFMAIRTVPVVMDIAKRMERLCPDAWLLNYANPTHFITAGVTRTTRIKTIGLCDNYICPMADFSWLLGMDEHLRSIKARHVGFNHCNWVYSAEFRGRDLMKEMLYGDQELVQRNVGRSPSAKWSFEQSLMLFRMTGWMPVGLSHFLPYFFHKEFLERQLASGKRPHSLVDEGTRKKWDMLKTQLVNYEDKIADQVARTQHGGAHADLAIGVASALAADTGEEYAVNIPHRGAVPGFAPDRVIELFAKISRKGCTPVKVPAFPPMIMAHQQHLFAYKKLVVDGILEKDKNKILQGLFIHPFTTSCAKAQELFAAMWAEEKDILGDYWN
jgi:6-phospho-beta-glucosidase